MPTTAKDVDLWRLTAREHQRLEFKEARTQFDSRKVLEYCVALANEGGGHLVLGVADKPPRPVVGTRAFADVAAVSEQLLQIQTVGLRVDVEEVLHPQGRVLVFNIPSRPRGTAYHLGGRYLMRSGEALVAMSEDQLRRIFAEGGPGWLEEPSKGGLHAQDVVDLLDTQSFFELLRLPYPTERPGVIDRLVRERLLDSRGATFTIRRLGALVQDLIRFVMGQLPQSEDIEDGLRRQAKLVPEIVVRELVANALIHQDLTVGGASVMVEVFSNRVEITNPGEPVVPVERFIDGYQSRNERLADLMRRMGICEEKSSGIDRVVHAVEAQRLPAPDFRAGHRRTTAIVFGPRAFREMGRDDRIRACYQHCALKWVTLERMTNRSLRERLRLPDDKAAVVSQVIAATIDAGLVRPDEAMSGSRRFARYVPFWA
jgi:predicted HTH transcriptional regulator